MGGLGGTQTFMHTFWGRCTFSGHWPQATHTKWLSGLETCVRAFLSPPAQPHMILTIGFENWEVSTNFGAKIPSVFVLTMVPGQFSSKLVHLGIFRTNWDHIKPTLGQFIFARLIHHFGISWTLLLKPSSPGSKVGSALIVKTCNGIVPRLFLITNSSPSSMEWRSNRSVPVWNLF